MIRFLFERREGHCELFAAGLVALCRSVGIPARMATGYRAGEFNDLGGYYVVRQEHAHAWAEAALGAPGNAAADDGDWPMGWTTFDATPPARVRAEHQRAGPAWFRWVRHVAEHAEYTWVSRVVAFGPGTRARAFNTIRSAFVTLFSDRLGWTRWIPAGPRWRVGAGVAAGLLCLGACLLGWRLIRRDRSARRRAARRPAAFGPGAGEGGVRRLGFYARLLDLLEKQGLERPADATPAAWAAELAAREPERFAGVPAVTEAFYPRPLRRGGPRRRRAASHRRDARPPRRPRPRPRPPPPPPPGRTPDGISILLRADAGRPRPPPRAVAVAGGAGGVHPGLPLAAAELRRRRHAARVRPRQARPLHGLRRARGAGGVGGLGRGAAVGASGAVPPRGCGRGRWRREWSSPPGRSSTSRRRCGWGGR